MADVAAKNPIETREGLLHLARLTMRTRDYRSMFDYTKKLIQMVMPTEDLTEDERDCFSSACKFFIDGHLNTWRHLDSVVFDSSAKCSRRESAREYQGLIADEIREICKDILELIDRSLSFSGKEDVAKKMTTETRVFYMMMKGDCLGYAAMVTKGPGRVNAEVAAIEAYNAAMEEASKLPELNQTRLKLALNFGTFHADLCQAFSLGCTVAKEALDKAKQAMAISEDQVSSDASGLLEELRNKNDIWMARIAAEPEQENKACRRLSATEPPFKG
ncbi:14-3-3-like protein isoform X2 [Phalaenopsis equestris]|nr:14-3-3-like protein isoform X2 [Phalaenopsis equestris]